MQQVNNRVALVCFDVITRWEVNGIVQIPPQEVAGKLGVQMLPASSAAVWCWGDGWRGCRECVLNRSGWRQQENILYWGLCWGECCLWRCGAGAEEQQQQHCKQDSWEALIQSCVGVLTFEHTSDYTLICRGVAQTASAPRLGRGGRRFKSAHPDFL